MKNATEANKASQKAGATGAASMENATMTTHTFNKSNWSGEQATIKVRKDGSFDFNGERVTLMPAKSEGEPITLAKNGELSILDILADGRKVGSLSRWSNETVWTASSSFASGLERFDAVPQVAAAKLLSNI